MPLDNSIAGWVIRKDRPLLIREAKNDPRWHQGVDETTDFETHSILGVPLKVRDNVIGVLEVVNKKTEDEIIDQKSFLEAEYMTLRSPQRIEDLARELGFKYPTQDDVFYIEHATVVGEKR